MFISKYYRKSCKSFFKNIDSGLLSYWEAFVISISDTLLVINRINILIKPYFLF